VGRKRTPLDLWRLSCGIGSLVELFSFGIFDFGCSDIDGEFMIKCNECKYWYRSTQDDQCDIPVKHKRYGDKAFVRAVYGESEVTDPRLTFIQSRQELVNYSLFEPNKVYGHPSQLNHDNKCECFKKVGWLQRLIGW
jgi:hypothetical protein